jgi:hypothetical protein
MDAAADKAAADASKSFSDNAAGGKLTPEQIADGGLTPAQVAAGLTPDQIAAAAKSAGDEAALNATVDPATAAAAGKAAVDALVTNTGATKVAGIESDLKGITANDLVSQTLGFWTQSSGIAKNLANLNYLLGTVPKTANIGTAMTKVETAGLLTGTLGLGGFAVAGFALSPAAG